MVEDSRTIPVITNSRHQPITLHKLEPGIEPRYRYLSEKILARLRSGFHNTLPLLDIESAKRSPETKNTADTSHHQSGVDQRFVSTWNADAARHPHRHVLSD